MVGNAVVPPIGAISHCNGASFWAIRELSMGLVRVEIVLIFDEISEKIFSMSSPHVALSGEDVDKSIGLKVDFNKFCVTPGASPRYFCISVFFFSGQSELIVSVDGKMVNVTPTSAINCREDFGGSKVTILEALLFTVLTPYLFKPPPTFPPDGKRLT